MGTNYYFKVKGFEDIDRLNIELDKSVCKIKDDYLKNLNIILDKYKNNYIDYIDLLNIDCVEDIVKFTVWGLDTPDIHICKLSACWIPCFESNKHFSNFKELEDFYNKYKNKLVLIDEYNKEIDFNSFKLEVFDRINNKNNQSHLQYSNSYGIRYYKDEFGVEWSTTQFE